MASKYVKWRQYFHTIMERQDKTQPKCKEWACKIKTNAKVVTWRPKENLSVVLLTLRVFLKRIRVTPVAAGRCRRVARRCGPTRRFVAGPRREGGARSRKHRLAGSHPHDL